MRMHSCYRSVVACENLELMLRPTKRTPWAWAASADLGHGRLQAMTIAAGDGVRGYFVRAKLPKLGDRQTLVLERAE